MRHVTLFVVGNYAPAVAAELAELVGAGHEIASHGPDHGRLPEERDRPARLAAARDERWSRTVLQRPGARFPLAALRRATSTRAGGIPRCAGRSRFRLRLRHPSPGRRARPSRELPVLTTARLPDRRRELPAAGAVRSGVAPRSAPPTGTSVLYYHSYDFGATPARPRSRSARRRWPSSWWAAVGSQRCSREVLKRYGSKACAHVER